MGTWLTEDLLRKKFDDMTVEEILKKKLVYIGHSEDCSGQAQYFIKTPGQSFAHYRQVPDAGQERTDGEKDGAVKSKNSRRVTDMLRTAGEHLKKKVAHRRHRFDAHAKKKKAAAKTPSGR